jgi:acetyltransferase-like isoleucine patch superfamily enzyme
MFSNVLVNVLGASHFISRRVRRICYRLNGLPIRGVNINPGAFFRTPKVKIGHGTFINNNCFFDNNEFVEIGEYCHVAMDVIFCTSSHEIGASKQRGGKLISAPIKIGNGCWIGARSTILPGVTIGEGCIIAAGSIVNKDCEPNGIYAGVPALRIKDLP